jgi:hypothetical protein
MSIFAWAMFAAGLLVFAVHVRELFGKIVDTKDEGRL